MKKILLTLAMVISLASSSSFASNQEITLAVNGSIIDTDVNPIAINGRTLVPIRAVSENLGAKVGWTPELQEVTLSFNNPRTTIKLRVGSRSLVQDGRSYEMDVAPQAINNRTMIPIRFISETLGFEVLWDNNTKTVNVKSENLDGLNDRVDFEDKRLEEVIREEIKKPKGHIYASDLRHIKSLYPAFDTIESLKGIEYLTDLRVLEIHKNNISDLTPLSKLENLKVLSIGDNPITDLSPLENLTRLTDLQMFRIRTSDIRCLEKLTNLTHLKISCNNIEDIDPLKNLTKLESLSIDQNQIRDISKLKNLTNLRDLHLQDNKVEDLDVLRNLKKLNLLDVTDNPLRSLAPLGSLEVLEFLFISPERLGEIKGFKNLNSTNINILPDW